MPRPPPVSPGNGVDVSIGRNIGFRATERHPRPSRAQPHRSRPSMSTSDAALSSALSESKAWPFEEARRLIERLEKLKGGADKTVIFETGYGPSGLPHIGTFGEVARTSMVRHAFEVLTEGKRKTRLICFSDDMDGLRKVPDNVPNQEHAARRPRQAADRRPRSVRQVRELRRTTTTRMLRALPRPLRLRLRVHLGDRVLQGRARFDETLLRMLKVYDKVMDIILPTLGPERRATYSPFLPVSPAHGPRAAGADGRAPSEEGHHRLPRSRDGQEGRDARSPAAPSSASGRPTGRCAGRRSASTTRWPART